MYVLLYSNGFSQVDRKKMSTDLTQKTFLTDSLSYLDEVEYCLRLKARWGRPTQLWPQSDSWRTPNGLERPLCAKEFHHPILWHKREKQKSWILMNDKAIAYKSSLVAKIKVVIKRGMNNQHRRGKFCHIDHAVQQCIKM